MKNLFDLQALLFLAVVLIMSYVGYLSGLQQCKERIEEVISVPADNKDRYYLQLQAAEGYAFHLMSEGYGEEWASHKAFVEVGLIEQDSLYWAIEED